MSGESGVSLKHMIVALDGSHLAETVLPLVRTLATKLGAMVTLLHVLEQEPPATVHGEPHLTGPAEAEAYLNQLADQLRSAGLTVETHVHPNPQRDVAASIAAHAAELNADLVVLAAHGRGGIREFLVGRIPQLVAPLARRPVLIVPAPTGRNLETVRRIMLPVDLAGESRAALPLARHLALACHSELFLATIVPTRGTLTGNAAPVTIFLPRTTSALLDLAEDQARNTLRQLANELAKEGLAVTTEVRRGEPAKEIVQDISAHDVDLVVMATHARAGLEGFLAGSVGPRVIANSPCPVLLVPIRE